MKLNQNSKQTLLSGESILLVTVIISFLYSFILHTSQDNKHIHEFESLAELSESIVTCPQTTSYQQSRYSTSESSDTRICPIDEERLGTVDKLRLDTWLNYHHIQLGGKFKPVGCHSRQKVALVIPYRDREEHLETFALYIHQFLPDQLIEYTVYVIEQNDNNPFNRAKLFNIGVLEILKLDPEVCCFIFHDVDLIPMDQRNLYMCSNMPRHLSPSVNTLRYNILYPNLFGGAISMTRDQYQVVGGFSNDFYGWGAEDDDIFRRVVSAGLSIDRTFRGHGVYIMLKHVKSKPNPINRSILNSRRQDTFNTTINDYAVKNIHLRLLFTLISVDLI